MGKQQPYHVTTSVKEARSALAGPIGSMRSGFNVNTINGDFFVDGEDALAAELFITDMVKRRIGANLALQDATIDSNVT